MTNLKLENTCTILLVCVCALSSFFFSGIIYGWAPMQLLLVNDRVLQNLCNYEHSQCPDQLTALNVIYTVGTTASVFACAIGGYLIDRYGFMATCSIAGILNSAGMIIFAIAPRESLITFCFGSALIGAGGMFTFMCSFKVGFSVHPENMTIVLSMCNCLFDCGGVLFLLFLKVYEMGFSRFSLCMMYAGFSVLFFALYVFLWTAKINSDAVSHAYRCIKEEEEELKELHDHYGQDPSTCSEKVAAPKRNICRDERDRFHKMKWNKQVFTYPFYYILMFTGVMMLKSNIYLGTAQIMLEQYGDEKDNNYYTRLLPAILPLGVVFILIIDNLMSKYGFSTIFDLICVLGMIFGSISLIPNLSVQIYAFIVYTAFRAFLYSAIATFNGHVFGPQNVGRLHGLSFCCAGVLGFLQPLIVDWVLKYCNGDMFAINFSLVLACLPVIFETERGLRPFLRTIGDLKSDENHPSISSPKSASENIETEFEESAYDSKPSQHD